jgi:hypothetical protein
LAIATVGDVAIAGMEAANAMEVIHRCFSGNDQGFRVIEKDAE